MDAIVIGSGMGGLTTAALLAKEGKQVLILEQHYVAGGFTHVFKRKGYEWDVGLHYIGAVHKEGKLIRRIFDDITEGRLQWAKMGKVYDRMVFDDRAYDYVEGEQAFIDQMVDYFPNERKAIMRYVDLVKKTVKLSKYFYMSKVIPQWMGTLLSPVTTRRFEKFSDRTTGEVIDGLTSNKKLKGVLCGQYGDYGLPPAQSSFAIHALVTYHYLDGGNYPVGGSSKIAETMVPTIEQSGGKIRTKAKVEQILCRQGKAYGVRLSGGEEVTAPVVISDAGVENTFGTLVADTQWLPLVKQELLPSASHLCAYLGLEGSATELNLEKTNLWIYPSYDHDRNIQDFVANPHAPPPLAYVSFPSAKDPSWEQRYGAKSTIEVIGFAPFEWFRSYQDSTWRRRGEAYEALKLELGTRLLDQFYKVNPELKKKVNYCEFSTPLSTRHFCNYKQGEIYGLEHSPGRFRQRQLRPQTPIKNLYLTGQDIATDGVVGAMMGGVFCASAVLRTNLLSKIKKRATA